MNTKNYFIYILTSISALTFISSCKKFVEVDPPADQVTNSAVFKDDALARAAVTGIYSEMMNNPNQFTTHAVSLYTGLSADELYYYSPGTRDEFTQNNLTTANHENLATLFWTPAYRYIYWANTSMEQMVQATTLSPQVRQTLMGEVKFIRAFCYFHLVNLFGDVPLVTTSDYTVNQSLLRTSKESVYDQIVWDLKDAYDLLSYDATNRAVRPCKWAAAAMLSRVYLYRKNWAEAEAWATKVIHSGNYSLNTNLQAVFLKDSKETIWQLQPVNPTRNTWEGNMILPASSATMPTYLLRPTLIGSFETGDGRLSAWTKSRVYAGQTLYYPYKYKVQTGSNVTEYYVLLRLAELYLVRAEARLEQNNLEGTKEDLNIIRNRAGLPAITTLDPLQLADTIVHERKIELFAEWGHRWFDLKRTGKAETVLSHLKGSNWQSTDVLYPIPISQINANGTLTQNDGY